MLPDPERKLLRILVNYPMHRRRMPEMWLIEQLTGRSRVEITQGLQSLENKGYILWQDESDIQSVVVMKDSEDVPQPAKQSSGIDYWTLY
ncbi:MAG: hypothetical protein ACQEXX_20075 [Bacillota bacterium]